MKPTEHPLQKALEARVRLLETTLQPSTVKQYRRTVRLFLGYLSQNFPEVHRPSQSRRDQHARSACVAVAHAVGSAGGFAATTAAWLIVRPGCAPAPVSPAAAFDSRG